MTKRIIIIGAGTGGLALGHALRKSKADISFHIYERHRTRTDGLFGYRVGISPEGSRCLAACLPERLFAAFVQTTAVAPERFNMVTEQYRELLSLDLSPSTRRSASSRREREMDRGIGVERSVSRMTLRQVLLTGLEDVVHFGKHFTHYSDNHSGTVTAFFADGTSATGDLLVGAEGTNSPTRKQYLPRAVLRDSGLCGIAAKVELSEATKQLLPPGASRAVTMINAPGGFGCIIHTMDFPWLRERRPRENDDGVAVARNDEELLRIWPGATFDNTRNYILLGFSAPMSSLPADIMSLGGPALHKLLLGRTSTWHPSFRELVKRSDPSTCFPINVRTTERLRAWPSTNVTLVGDAIHTMTPGLGVGANTALLDATILAENLVRVARGQQEVVTAVADYEAEMHSYAWDRVEKSLKWFDKDAAIYASGVRGSLALMWIRLVLRMTNFLPPLKRRMAAEMTRERDGRTT
ncbi:hypothetical protein E4U42_002960 [Claviceps africana]|uniref:FAD-binding domain-containing protein n=1 Tax=Claviceps africana TaxID=83212 RepID=A0A8K0J7U3_9HYPO|nr:hypothetical protein E4U42_002960 [Claviceps africana]